MTYIRKLCKQDHLK